MRSHRFAGAAAAALLLFAPAHAGACWDDVGRKYGISPYLLYAIARTESGLNPNAFNRNRNGTYDVGLMQINSSWLPVLARYGITEQGLYEPCVNVDVAGWILAQNIRRLGNSWTAVGAYNAADAKKRLDYAMRVYRNLPPEMKAAQPTQGDGNE